MHRPTEEGLEGYLEGTIETRLRREFERHLDACDQCRATVRSMKDQRYLISQLRAEEPIEPAPDFYARVIERIESQRYGSVWTLFLDPAFGRRLFYASVTLLVLLGTYLVSTEPVGPAHPRPESVFVAVECQSPPSTEIQRERDTILVNLATYPD